jgi:hypothetical protein
MGLPCFVVALRDATLDGIAGVQPCVALTPGFDRAARQGTPFAVELTLVYYTGGRLAFVRSTVPLNDTQLAGQFDARTVLVQVVIKVSNDGTPVPQPDERGMFTASARLVLAGQAGAVEVIAPNTTNGLVGGNDPLPG